ncbi:MAG: zinc-ribbon domain-containing protein [Myxococcota bacterium]
MGTLDPAKSRMLADCPRCRARYRVLANRLPRQGTRLRCAVCRACFRVRLPLAPPSAPLRSRASAAPQARRAARDALPPDRSGVSPKPPSTEAPRPPQPSDATNVPEGVQRLARIVASELALYHAERFDAGIRKGDVLAAMAPEIAEGQLLLAQRMESGEDAGPILEREVLRVAAERASERSD